LLSGRQTRERIIVAVSELIFAKGVAGTSIPDLQKEAGVGASQIYHYFGNKRGLVRAVIDHQIETSLNSQRPILDHLGSFEGLRAWCDDAVAIQQERGCEGGCEISSLAAELVGSDPIVRSDLVKAFERFGDTAGLHPILAGLCLDTTADEGTNFIVEIPFGGPHLRVSR
jgi:TetR/AcrR family transcriptional regulator, transcriptional repressor for nem operon